jgi:hypothetical protein
MAYTRRVKSVPPALAVMLAGAALTLGAAVAWAGTPPARGGQALPIVPQTAAGGRVDAPTTEPSPGAPVGSTTEPPPASPAAPVTPEPITSPGISSPSFTVSQVGNTVTLDASASTCHNGGCDFSWRLYADGGNRLGSTMGFGPVLTYTLPAAGVYQVVLTKSEYCAPGGGASLRSCPRTAQQTITAT